MFERGALSGPADASSGFLRTDQSLIVPCSEPKDLFKFLCILNFVLLAVLISCH